MRRARPEAVRLHLPRAEACEQPVRRSPQAGPSKHMNWYNPNPGGSTSPAGLRGNDADAMNGNAVMFDAVAGQILTVGGAPSYQVRPVTTASVAWRSRIHRVGLLPRKG